MDEIKSISEGHADSGIVERGMGYDNNNNIDLSLAVNYLPAVECVCKGVVLTFILIYMHPGKHMWLFIIIGLLLNIDRVLSSFRIFDGNTLISAIFVSHVINYLRENCDNASGIHALLTYVVIFTWLLLSYLLLIEPLFVSDFINSNRVIRRVHAAVITALGVGIVSLTQLSPESGGQKLARSLSFLLLCIVWI